MILYHNIYKKTFLGIFFLFLLLFLLNITEGKEMDLTRYKDKNAADLLFLTEGVTGIPPSGLPGPIAIHRPNAFPVITGIYKENVRQPLVVASRLGKGRIVAFGHDGYFSVDLMKQGDMERFFLNCIQWCSQQEKSNNHTNTANLNKIRIAVWRNPPLTEILTKKGYNAQSVQDFPVDCDIFIGQSEALNDTQYEILIDKIAKGGCGYITGSLGWGWLQLNPGKTLVQDHHGNKNLVAAGAGFAWVDGSLRTDKDNLFEVKTPITPWINGSLLLNRFKNVLSEKSKDILTSEEQRTLSPEEKKAVDNQISTTLQLTYGSLPENLRKRLGQLNSKAITQLVPNAKQPVRNTDLVSRLLIILETEQWRQGQLQAVDKPKTIEAFESGNDFPGPVPKDAPRLKNQKITINPKVPDWQSTGFYAPPGQMVTIEFPADMDSNLLKKYKIRIGAHTDELWHQDQWNRFPAITIAKPINNNKTTLANPFGGPVYVVVPYNQQGNAFEVRISGVVAAPMFVRDQTRLDDWKKTIRNNPAPWTELQGNNIILTVPSSVVRDLDDPQALLETWDKALDIIAEFCSAPKNRVRPERMCPDRQISAGYMHSGYPVMTHLDVVRDYVDREKMLTKGNWGFFHELGHNHQSAHWTFDGTTEVTVNYFTLYVYDKLCGIPVSKSRDNVSPETRRRLLDNYIKNGRRFEDWKSDPFLALNMAVQLQEAFGWDPFIKTIAEYRTAKNDELPKNDDEKRNQWLVRLSKNIGRNLGPFFEYWGVPTSQAARDSIKNLPTWMPKE